MKKIGYGLIGFGSIAETKIAKEGFGLDRSRFTGHPQAELIGATDISPSKRHSVESMGLNWYDSAECLLRNRDIGAVFITTNNLSHAPLAERVIKAGRHCIVEKPMATTVEDARDLQQTAAAFNVKLTVDHMMTENVYNRRARDLIAEKAIGEVNNITLKDGVSIWQRTRRGHGLALQ